MREFLYSGALDFVYAGIVVVSFIFALLSLIGASSGEAPDFDVDAGTDDFLGIPISPLSLAVFGSAFGITGLITHLLLETSVTASILWATGIGLLLGVLAQVFFIYSLAQTRSSNYSLEEDAIGREAEVIVSIPCDGLGQIAFRNVGGRVALGARSITGVAIDAGELVTIEKMVGRAALVRRSNARG